MPTLHDFSARTISGEETSLRDYAGKVALVVNVASKCGLTPQYNGLEKLYETLQSRGLEVLGFPCNQFAGQEPGADAEVQEFCTLTYGVKFPLFSKIDVNGAQRHPLYAWLTAATVGPEEAGDIQWNFGKFLVGRDGKVLARFAPPTAPEDPALVAAIEKALG
jgi:glutathione peroxidase